jgi:hypothetical protein
MRYRTNLLNQRYKLETTENLKHRGLQINDSKTEEYKINRRTGDWKKCKFLGTILDTDEDIKRRKILAINAAKNLNHLFNNKNLTTSTKMKILQTYVQPIFLYNCETWTLTKRMEEKLDAFQRTLIRTFVLNIIYPNKISNERLRERTELKDWSKVVQKRRLAWFEKLINQEEFTPMQEALRYATSNYRKPPGKPKTTWISRMKEDLGNLGWTWTEAVNVIKTEKKTWEDRIKHFFN